MKTLFVSLLAIAIGVAVAAYPNWKASVAVAPRAASPTPAGDSSAIEKSLTADLPPAAMTQPTPASIPPPPNGGDANAADSSLTDATKPGTPAFNNAVGQSQRAAVAKYPELAKRDSPLNVRFRNKLAQWRAKDDPRLRDAHWPETLAAEASREPAVVSLKLASGKTLFFDTVEQRDKYEAGLSRSKTGTALVSAAQPSRGTPFIGLEATGLSSGGQYQLHWLTYYDDYDVTGRVNRALSIRVRNVGQQDADIKVQWYFFARSGGVTSVFDGGEKTMTLAPRTDSEFAVRSTNLEKHDVTDYYTGARRVYGSEIEGWLVVASVDGQVIKRIGSKDQLEQLAGSAQLEQMASARVSGPGARQTSNVKR